VKLRDEQEYIHLVRPSSRGRLHRSHHGGRGSRANGSSGIINSMQILMICRRSVITLVQSEGPSKQCPSMNHLEETLFFPEPFTRQMERAWDHLGNVSKRPGFVQLSDFSRRVMKDLSVGFWRFATPPTLGPVRFQSHAPAAAISRLRPVQDALDYWQPFSVSSPPTPPPTKSRAWSGSVPSPLPSLGSS
jgi:hypothetical protein